jgi:hypothetical protein
MLLLLLLLLFEAGLVVDSLMVDGASLSFVDVSTSKIAGAVTVVGGDDMSAIIAIVRCSSRITCVFVCFPLLC